jgi:hypothetical protein
MNQEGTAGYVMVSATNERDVKLVQMENLLELSTNLKLIFNRYRKAFIFLGYSTVV